MLLFFIHTGDNTYQVHCIFVSLYHSTHPPITTTLLMLAGTTTVGNCVASGNKGGSVDCTGSRNCLCGEAKTCGGKVKTGKLSCMKAETCDCSGVSYPGTCCGVGAQITAKPTGTSAVVKDQACCGDCSASSSSALTMSASAVFVAAVVFGASL